jgi:chromosome segregation ATPase
MDSIQGIPVLKVDNVPIDLYSGKKAPHTEAFVESLTHKSYIISIPDLNKKRRTELETLLSIFDQSAINESHHILNVKEGDFPEKFRPIISRLRNAMSEEDMRNKMEIEDDFISELAEYERKAEEAEKQKEEAEKQKEEAEKRKEEAEKQKEEAEKQKEEAEKQKEEAEKQKEEAEKQKEEAEKRKEEAEKQKEEAEKRKEEAEKQKEEAEKQKEEAENKAQEIQVKILQTVENLFNKGMSVAEISSITGFNVKEIEGILSQL